MLEFVRIWTPRLLAEPDLYGQLYLLAVGHYWLGYPFMKGLLLQAVLASLERSTEVQGRAAF